MNLNLILLSSFYLCIGTLFSLIVCVFLLPVYLAFDGLLPCRRVRFENFQREIRKEKVLSA